MDVTVKIQSKIENLDASGLPEGEIEKTESNLCGRYEYSEESAALTYDECGEGGRVSSEITVSGGSVSVKRTGAIESLFVFRNGEEYDTVYSVPPYKFDVKLKPRKIRAELNEEGGLVDLFYNMSIGGADKAVRMKIWIQMN